MYTHEHTHTFNKRSIKALNIKCIVHILPANFLHNQDGQKSVAESLERLPANELMLVRRSVPCSVVALLAKGE